jgi:hypothetical protein
VRLCSDDEFLHSPFSSGIIRMTFILLAFYSFDITNYQIVYSANLFNFQAFQKLDSGKKDKIHVSEIRKFFNATFKAAGK